MSIKRDLERWSAEQLANISAPNLLAQRIRRILRGVDTVRLTGLGGAGFPGQQREARPGEPEDTTAPAPVFALDSGLLVSAVTPAYPLKIYCDTSLTSYFGSSGTEIIGRLDGGSPVYEFLVGVAESSATTCSASYAIPDWQDAAPTLDADNAYSSYVWTAGTLSSEETPSLYSGLMRLAVQCKIGARKSPDELAGFGALSPTAHGLAVDTNSYTFWAIQCGIAGVSAKKMQNSARSECIRQQLAAGDIAQTSADFIRYLAWLLSDLTPSADSAVGLLTSAEVSDVYSNGKSPLAHGWKFSRLSNKASITTYRELAYNEDLNCGESGTWTVSVTFNESGVPSASIANTTALTQFRTEPTVHCLWYPAAGLHQILRQAFTTLGDERYDPFSGNVADIYCWYDDSDTLQTITYEQYDKTDYASGRSFTQGSPVACNGGPGWYRTTTAGAGHTAHIGGYLNSANPLAGSASQTTGSMTENEYVWEYGDQNGTITVTYSSADISTVMTSRWVLRPSDCDLSAVAAWKDDYYATEGVTSLPARRIMHYGSGTGSHITQAGTREDFTNIVVIPENDAESVYQALLDEWTGGYRQVRIGINDGLRNDLGTHGNYAVFHSVTPALAPAGTTDWENYPVSPVDNGVGFNVNLGGGFQGLGVQGFMFGLSNVWESDDTDSSSTRQTANASLVVPHGEQDVDQAYADWSYYIWQGQTDDTKSQLLDVLSSYKTSSIHNTAAVADSVELTGGYSVEFADLPAYRRWVGFI